MLEIFTTVAKKAEVQRIANALVGEKLVACVCFWPVSSVYRWKSKVHRAGEWMLCAKTSEKVVKKVEKKLRELHPYNLPVITIAKCRTNKKAEKWLAAEL